MNIPSPIFAHYFQSKVGRRLKLKYLVGLDYTFPQMCRCRKIIQSLGCSYPEEQQQYWSCTMRISQVCQYFPQKSNSEITCIVSGDRKWRETRWFNCVSISSCQGEMEMLVTLFAKLKAYFKPVLQIHILLYATTYSVHVYLRYSRRCSIRAV